ncbi:DegT/DnrJ/EryC1/StrS family aminotransferase, partial [Rhodobacteraceae bacterium]|nr:DegT/DnrJ/EryC1/StrS family aminotransferase [Paracoccaceae bacterium]
MRIVDCLISDQASLRRVLLSLENAAYKVCVVVKDDGAILRTITDGDIRRALIDGSNLDTKVRDITGKTPITCLQNASQQELISVLDEHQINFVVIVDEDNRPVDLADRVSLLSFLYLSPPHMGSKEVQYVNLAFEENYIAPAGKNLVEFENELMKVSGKTNALALSSGTAGLHLALEVLGVDVGDRVYVSDVTFIAS